MALKKNNALPIVAATIGLAFLLFAVKQFETMPWWGFTVPVFVAGLVFPHRRWNLPAFAIGFWAGFIVWAGMNAVYTTVYEGEVLAKVALTLGVQSIVLQLASGIIGGLLTGLTFYAGKSAVFKPAAEAHASLLDMNN